MTLNSLVIRAAACGIVGVGGVLYAIQSGLIGSAAEAQAVFIPDTDPPGELILNTDPPGSFTLTSDRPRLSAPAPEVATAPVAAEGFGAPNAPAPAPVIAEAPQGEAPIVPAAPAPEALAAEDGDAPKPEDDVTLAAAGPAPAEAPVLAPAPAPVPVAAATPVADEVPGAAPDAPAIAAAPSLPDALPEAVQTAEVRLPVIAPVAPEAQVVPASLPGPATPAAPDTTLPPAGEVSALGLPCGISVTATAMPAAMVALDIMAPCRTDAAVTIVHSGLRLEAQTDALGLLTLDVPAFETPAFFSVTFADGVDETVLVGLPDLRDYDRIGLTWTGDLDLELHAMEFGASFGGTGHVWPEAPGSTEMAMEGSGGFLTLIETGGTHAQIYTFPRGALREGDTVALSIDAPITEANCTQSASAQTLRSEGAGPVDVTELTFTVPDCDAVGDVLVLQNILSDLRLAAN